jgi:hypothetical protein
VEHNDNLSPQFGSYDYHDLVSTGDHPPAMFATAKEIIKTHHLGDMDEQSTKRELIHEKLENADSYPGMGYDEEPEEQANGPADERQSGQFGGLTQRIREGGYDWSKPVRIRAHGEASTLLNGHHRVAVMRRDRPEEFLPIRTDV